MERVEVRRRAISMRGHRKGTEHDHGFVRAHTTGAMTSDAVRSPAKKSARLVPPEMQANIAGGAAVSPVEQGAR